MKERSVLFFDGVCGLCNGVVDFILAHESKPTLKFSPLQSDFAKATLPISLTQDLNTLVLLKNDQTLTKSQAVLEICRLMGGAWKLFLVFSLIPRSMRDSLYDLIAKSRYQTFGKREICRLPSSSEKERFLL